MPGATTVDDGGAKRHNAGAMQRVAAAIFAPIAAGARATPLYRQVKSALLRAIESGQCQAGAALPSEAALAAALGVSIGTLRHATDDLVAEHILVRRQGRGTFVAVHNADRFMFQFFHVERSDGLRQAPRVELLAFERVRIEEEPALALGLKPGEPAIRIDNRLLLQGKAVIHDQLTLPAALFKGLTEKRLRERKSTIYHLYQTEFGITVTRAREHARAAIADRSLSRLLGVASGAPVLVVRRTALTFGDKPVEYRISTIDTARHEYVHLLSRPA
ncbi:GntR family transcriptional regulator [Verminephrobacter eiseniae]|uniref:GntR family transcriptional regulator n=1 Tax=Verminephrobacter eiseniae TaxID=364317 RepID=UPI002238C153|nr:GntR family transcriptional regulator [Verminephrobacter eiseniae]